MRSCDSHNARPANKGHAVVSPDMRSNHNKTLRISTVLGHNELLCNAIMETLARIVQVQLHLPGWKRGECIMPLYINELHLSMSMAARTKAAIETTRLLYNFMSSQFICLSQYNTLFELIITQPPSICFQKSTASRHWPKN
jgi:hypothetical protein